MKQQIYNLLISVIISETNVLLTEDYDDTGYQSLTAVTLLLLMFVSLKGSFV